MILKSEECSQIEYCVPEEEPPSKVLKKDQDLSRFSTRDLLTLARQELDHDQLPRWVGSAKICGCCLGKLLILSEFEYRNWNGFMLANIKLQKTLSILSKPDKNQSKQT